MDRQLKCEKCGKEIEQEETVYPIFYYFGILGDWYHKNSFCKDCAGLANFLGIMLFGLAAFVVFFALVIKFLSS